MKARDQGGGQTQVDTEEWGVVIILKTETLIFSGQLNFSLLCDMHSSLFGLNQIELMQINIRILF